MSRRDVSCGLGPVGLWRRGRRPSGGPDQGLAPAQEFVTLRHPSDAFTRRVPLRQLNSEFLQQALGSRHVTAHRPQLLDPEHLSREPVLADGDALLEQYPLFLCSFTERCFGHRWRSHVAGVSEGNHEAYPAMCDGKSLVGALVRYATLRPGRRRPDPRGGWRLSGRGRHRPIPPSSPARGRGRRWSGSSPARRGCSRRGRRRGRAGGCSCASGSRCLS